MSPFSSPQSAEPFRLLVESVRDYAIFMLSVDGTVASWNSGAERIKGYHASEIIGRPYAVFFLPEDTATGKPERLLRAAEREGRVEHEGWRLRKDGTRFWASVVVTALRDEHGTLRGYAKVTRDMTEPRQALEALRQSEGRMAATLDSIGDAVIATDEHGLVTRMNPVAERLTGWPKEEALGRPLAEIFRIVNEETRAPVENPVDVVLRENRTVGLANHTVLIAKNGTERPIADSGAPIRGLDGGTRGTVMVFRDATDERAAAQLEAEIAAREAAEAGEARLRASEERYRLQSAQLAVILESVADGITAQRPDGTLLYANDAAARSCGFASASELLAAGPDAIVRLFDAFDEHGAPFDWARLPGRRALAGEDNATATLRIQRRSDGAEWWSTVRARAVRDVDGTPYLAVNVWRDVTEQRRREHEAAFLSEATAVLSSGLDGMVALQQLAKLCVPRLADFCAVHGIEGDALVPIGIEHADSAKVRIAAELSLRYPPHLQREFGVGHVALTGRSELLEDIPDQLLALAVPDPQYQRVLRELGLCSAMVVPMRARGRTLGVLSLVSAESRRRFGPQDLAFAEELGRRAGLALDNARLYREAQEAIRARDEFLSIAGHELKTPLAALLLQVSGLVRLYEQGAAPNPARALERLNKTALQAKRIDKLIDELLDVSRITSGRLRLELEDVELFALAEEVVARFGEEAARAGCALELRALEKVQGHWDRLRIDQVLTNLISNAIKYGAHKPVLIEVGTQRDGARVSVRDHGIGIAPEHQARIFGRFERAVSERYYGGFGLGLWIAREIIQAHGGAIRLDSREGAGSTFTIDLPLAPS